MLARHVVWECGHIKSERLSKENLSYVPKDGLYTTHLYYVLNRVGN